MNHFFGQNLKALRLDKKLSQEGLGRELNKGQKTIGNWETGYSEPCLEDLIRISHFFEVDIDKLLKQEIKIHQFKAKIVRISSKQTDPGTGNLSLAIHDVKQALQQSTKENAPVENSDIAWRDRYITVLENQLFETSDRTLPRPTVQDLMNQMLAIQKTLAELIV